MTVLVGVLCTDGVVVGSDSSATFSAAPNLNTIEQPVQKTFIVGNDVIFATAGAGGLGQRLEFILQGLRQAQDWRGAHHLPIALEISRRMLQNLQHTFQGPGQLGALVAFACQNAFHLCEFALTDFQPEMKTKDTWFVSMGSGQMITDPFFGLLRRTLFRNAQPTLHEGVLAAYWALDNAIQLNTGGINGPIQLAVLRRTTPEAPFEARLLGADERTEHARAIKSLEDYLAAYRQQLTPQAAESEKQPEPPPPDTENKSQS
jgi:20S proteasome alpha/beta subunit